MTSLPSLFGVTHWTGGCDLEGFFFFLVEVHGYWTLLRLAGSYVCVELLFARQGSGEWCTAAEHPDKPSPL